MLPGAVWVGGSPVWPVWHRAVVAPHRCHPGPALEFEHLPGLACCRSTCCQAGILWLGNPWMLQVISTDALLIWQGWRPGSWAVLTWYGALEDVGKEEEGWGRKHRRVSCSPQPEIEGRGEDGIRVLNRKAGASTDDYFSLPSCTRISVLIFPQAYLWVHLERRHLVFF
jgi:hypothetical protein